MISSIIVGIDGSDAAERALRMACGIAKQFDAKLQISHTPRDETVTYAAEAISGFYVGPNAAHQELLREAAEKLGEKATAIAAEEGVAGVELHIGHGDPARNLLDLAKKTGADLIVTGRRGLGDFSALVLGSTSNQISKKAQCACLTVP
ncbi:universal stress protein [Sulfitobacter sp. F26169L]|uniref:universal stress protein n=1 Tax=Sulfitobacter sp. F26169L TaxID=2996015 RepID=UPI002260860B|nr:universal stress protein [Sulfitobacter sp. F26169L]MCX7566891.1 universal stress protein [Sulfitobacter sp. F26169L]